MNPNSWQDWIKYFEAKGYTCYAPAYPFHKGNPADLRAKPDPRLGKVTFDQVVDVYTKFIQGLPEQPILIGHSMGGAVVQKLINNGLGVAGVCIDTAPPQGIFTLKFSFLKANLPTINPLKGDSVSIPDVNWFHYAFCNMMTIEQTQIEYDKFFTPESRNIPRTASAGQAKIDFKKPHVPLLFIAGENDHIIPASLNQKNFDAYKDPSSLRTFKQFPGRCHYLCAQTGWQEIAEYVSAWIK